MGWEGRDPESSAAAAAASRERGERPGASKLEKIRNGCGGTTVYHKEMSNPRRARL